jgi:NAD(P)-dependent dehydrogenase (short-subunit alcohol dehydrogenase family)
VSEPALAGRRIVVGGGTGDIGVEIVAQLLQEGAEVLVPVRDVRKADVLKRQAPTGSALTIVDAFPQDDDGVARLQDAVRRWGPCHGAVASLGPWFHGPAIAALPTADWQRMVTASLTSHFLFARSVVPVLAPRGQYVMLNGAAALVPVVHSGVVSVMAAAQTMLGQVLAAENPSIRVHTLMLKSIVATRARPQSDPSWLTSHEVGAMTAWLFTEAGRLTGGTTLQLTPKDLS